LEIRGAGNLLGADQSGHIAAVGYDLYVQMVSEAVAELKGEEPRPPAEIKLDLPLAAHLPEDYVGREDLRLEAYRRLATVTSQAEVDDIRSEWLDRFGPLPTPAEALLGVGSLRAECARIGLREVTVTLPRPGARSAVVRMAPIALRPSAQVRLHRALPSAVYKEDLSQVVSPIDWQERDGTGQLVDLLGALVPREIGTEQPIASPAP
ncbi:MAG: TRCF domain-containing protein, partial [Mycobacterium sp.]